MLQRSWRLVVLVLLVAQGCGDSATGGSETEDAGSTGAGPGTSTLDTIGTTTDAETGASEDTGAETGFDPPEPECGNGFVEPGEQCDDGNDVDDDECTNECLIRCGVDWEVTKLPPTGESLLMGQQVVRDAQDAIVTAGLLREVTTDQQGEPTLGFNEVMLAKYDASGDRQWDARIALGEGHTELGGLAIDPNGDIYLAMTVAVEEGSDIVVSKRAASDGAELWQHTYDSQVDTSVDSARGLAVTDDGDVVVTGTIRAAPMDDDVWVRKLAGEDGDEQWTTTWSGAGNGTFSTDRGGPVAVGSSGAAYVLVREYVDVGHSPVVVLRVSPGVREDVEIQTWLEPEPPVGMQIFTPVGIGVDDDENVVFALEWSGAGYEFWVHKVDATGSEIWVRERLDFETEDLRLTDIVLDATGHLVLVGEHREVDNQLGPWFEVWLRRLDHAGDVVCGVEHRGSGGGVLPPSLFAAGGATRSDGGAIVTGRQELEDETSLWLATFRPN